MRKHTISGALAARSMPLLTDTLAHIPSVEVSGVLMHIDVRSAVVRMKEDEKRRGYAISPDILGMIESPLYILGEDHLIYYLIYSKFVI